MINTLIFDLGVVLIHLHPERGLERLRQYAPHLSENEITGFFQYTPYLTAYEKGETDTETFFSGITGALDIDIKFHDFQNIWNGIFSDNTHMSSLLPALKQEYQLILLSNTNRMHAEYCLEQFPFMRLFDHLVFSYKEKSMKPDEKIYKAALRYCGEAEAALFIDDKQINIDGAANCGIRAIRYDNPQSCISSMRAAGVNIPDQK